jgi:hypothetical protein
MNIVMSIIVSVLLGIILVAIIDIIVLYLSQVIVLLPILNRLSITHLHIPGKKNKLNHI